MTQTGSDVVPRDIFQATGDYEAWLGRWLSLVGEDLDRKHAEMRTSAFAFLRATFYRWAERWPVVCPDLATAPKVLAVGDVHVENFGTWRDVEGRLVWGVNDVDEAAALPYPSDLVRLATSAELADGVKIKLPGICEAVLAGYTETLHDPDPQPFVLAERHGKLRKLATERLKHPEKVLGEEAGARRGRGPRARPGRPGTQRRRPAPRGRPARWGPGLSAVPAAGRAGQPRPAPVRRPHHLARRAGRPRRQGTGALGLALGAHHPGRGGARAHPQHGAAHPPGPLPRSHRGRQGRWIVRRLAPDCSRVELGDLAEDDQDDEAARDQQARLLTWMGQELAGLHRASPYALATVQAHLAGLTERAGDWLCDATEAMAAATRADFEAYRGS